MASIACGGDEQTALFEERVFAATGVLFRDAPPVTQEDYEDKSADGYWAIRHQMSKEVDSPDPDLTRWSANTNRLFCSLIRFWRSKLRRSPG